MIIHLLCVNKNSKWKNWYKKFHNCHILENPTKTIYVMEADVWYNIEALIIKANIWVRPEQFYILLKASAKNSRSYYLTRGLKRVARPWGVIFISFAFDNERQT